MKSKSGRPMAFATIDDSSGTMEISMFDHVDEFEEYFQVGKIIIATGTTKLSTYQNTNGQTVMQAVNIIDIEQARREYAKGLRVDIDDSLLTKDRAKALRISFLSSGTGRFPLSYVTISRMRELSWNRIRAVLIHQMNFSMESGFCSAKTAFH